MKIIKTTKSTVIWFLFLSMFLLASTMTYAANVITIDDYNTIMTLNSNENKLEFEKQITLKNTGKNTIIPGELHFKLYEITDKEIKKIPKIEGLKAEDKYKNDLSARIVTKQGEAEVVVSAWQPIMPKFEYDVILKYEMEFEPKGILFHNINFPNEETTIPIRNSDTLIRIPKGITITYAPNATIETSEKYTLAKWENIEDKTIEYTKIPFIRTNVHGATIFWIGLIVLLTIPLIVILLSELKNRK